MQYIRNRSPLFIILGICSILLGGYLIIMSIQNYFLPDYHIGCYLSHTTNDNYFKLKSKFNKLKHQGDLNRKIDQNMKSLQLVDPELRLKSVTLTKNVDSYIQKLALMKQYQEANMQFFAQLQKAKQQYQTCVSDLNANLNLEESKSLWSQYKSCFDKYQDLKTNIKNLYRKRNSYLEQIDSLLIYDPSVNPNFDFEGQLKKIKEKYDRKNRQNDKNKADYISDLKMLQQKHQAKQIEYDQAERQSSKYLERYEICLKNLKQFRKCENISKVLQSYGQLESIDSLQSRIKSKREMLYKMRELVLKSRQDGGNNSVMSEMYQKRQKQLIEIIKLRLRLDWDQMKQCGCTQQNRIQLENKYQKSKQQLSLDKKQLNDISNQIYKTQRAIKQTDIIREQLVKQYTQETQRLKNRQTTNIVTLKQRLELLRANITIINGQIRQYERKLNSLEFLCNQYKDRLGNKLHQTQKIADCLTSKNYFDQLKEKAKLIIRKDDESALPYKQSIKNSLKSIKYPETTPIRNLILMNQQLPDLSNTQTPKEEQTPSAPQTLSVQQTSSARQPVQKIEEYITETQVHINTPDEEIIIVNVVKDEFQTIKGTEQL